MTETLSDERGVILTFDDGPEPVEEALVPIVKALDAERIKGCFFLVGERVARRPDAVKMLADHGHEVANHNWEHVSMPKLTEEQMYDQLRRTQEAIHAACGVTPVRFRPPFGEGFYNAKCPALLRSAARLNLEVIGWTLDTYDWKKPWGIRFDRVKDRLELFLGVGRADSVELLMHVYPPTGQELPRLIDMLREMGFGFKTY